VCVCRYNPLQLLILSLPTTVVVRVVRSARSVVCVCVSLQIVVAERCSGPRCTIGRIRRARARVCRDAASFHGTAGQQRLG